MGRGWLVGCCLLFTLGACTPRDPAHTPSHPRLTQAERVLASDVVDTQSRTHSVGDLVSTKAWTALVFFSATCPTVSAHDARLIALWDAVRNHDVGLVMVASERDASLAMLRHESASRGYPFPLVWDRNGQLAAVLGVRYASQAFILSRAGEVAYAGSIDSDRRFLHDDATPYLRDAITAVEQGQRPAPADDAAYGCALALER